VGFILGLETPLLLRTRTPEDIAALPTSRYPEWTRRDPSDDERAAIARLEPVLLAVLTGLQETPELR
jgi:hypothetical protein